MIVVIESPYAGDVDLHAAYLRACLRDSLLRGESPMASHGLYTQPGVLDDDEPEERRHGIEAGLRFYDAAGLGAVYQDLGISRGMRQGIARARERGVRVEFRRIAPVTIEAVYHGAPALIVIRELEERAEASVSPVLIRSREAAARCTIRKVW